jgi:hypothetical protein
MRKNIPDRRTTPILGGSALDLIRSSSASPEEALGKFAAHGVKLTEGEFWKCEGCGGGNCALTKLSAGDFFHDGEYLSVNGYGTQSPMGLHDIRDSN